MNKQAQSKPATNREIPAYMPEELIPLYDWYNGSGRQVLISLAIVLLVALGTASYLRHRENRSAEAAAALLSATSTEGIENLNEQYGGGKAGSLVRLRLAASYFKDGNFKSAGETYAAFLKDNKKHELAPAARIGLAAATEGQEKFDEARQLFASFSEDNPEHYLTPLATMGEARCLAALKRKEEALAMVDRLIVTTEDTVWEPEARELRQTLAHFKGIKTRSIFEQLDAAAKAQIQDSADAETMLDAPAKLDVTLDEQENVPEQ